MSDGYITGEDLLMSFVLRDKYRENLFVRTICLEEISHCNVECRQNQVETLFHRSSNYRQFLIAKYYDFFGLDFFDDKVEKLSEHIPGTKPKITTSIEWQNDNDRIEGICKSNNDMIGSKPPCRFCGVNAVCPDHVVDH